MDKVIIDNKGKSYLLRTGKKEFHCKDGGVSHIDSAKVGDILTSNKEHTFHVLHPLFLDYYNKIKRKPQIIPLKDIGTIITRASLGKDSVIIEAGAGSGGLTCFLAQIVKHVYSYEKREDFFKVVQSNIEHLNLKNITLVNQDITEGFNQKNVDAVILDLVDPWNHITHATRALKIGGMLVTYCPTIPQVMDVIAQSTEFFVHIETLEIMERSWDVHDRKVRPKTQTIGHSGFLSFLRSIQQPSKS